MQDGADLDTLREQISELMERMADVAYAKAENLQKIASIRCQLAKAGEIGTQHGIPQDVAWRISAKGALRRAGSLDQKYGTQLGELKNQIKALNVRATQIQTIEFGRAFIAAARQLLPQETYYLILDQANEQQRAVPP